MFVITVFENNGSKTHYNMGCAEYLDRFEYYLAYHNQNYRIDEGYINQKYITKEEQARKDFILEDFYNFINQ